MRRFIDFGYSTNEAFIEKDEREDVFFGCPNGAVLFVPRTHPWGSPVGVERVSSSLVGGVSAGGGQLMTCRDLARVGTLLVQRGSWEDARGEPYQLLSEDYVKQQLTPSFPDFNGGYDSLAVG